MAETAKKFDEARTPPVNTPRSLAFKELDLFEALPTPSKKDRGGQRVHHFRELAGKTGGYDVELLEHPAGVEVRGTAWSGVVPWAMIKRAVR